MRKTVYVVLIAVFTTITACKKEETPDINQPATIAAISSQKDITQFKFEAKNNPEQLLRDIECHISDGRIVGSVPYISSNKALVATFTINGASIVVNGELQASTVTRNDFSRSVTYTVRAGDNTTKDYTVSVYTFTGLPILYLETEALVVSKDIDVKGKMTVDANSRYDQPVTEMTMTMRGRGNSTWDMPKKPYRIKLDTKAAMLGMPAAKKWVLLANFADKTLMRNYLALEIGQRFGAAFTPRSRYVEVILNGEYLGNYLLTDQVEIGETRVNIPELKTTSTDISGGYLLEIDERLGEPIWFRTILQVPVNVKSPEDITTPQLNYIKDYMQKIENALYTPTFTDTTVGYSKFINTETFINWYLVNELLKNNDAIFFSSVFMYKDRNAKLSIGPIWDFDLAIGNINYNGNNDPNGWWIKQSIWINRLFDDPAFVKKVKDRWNVLKATQVNSLFTFINDTRDYLQYSQTENFNKWELLYNYTWADPVILGSYDSEVQHMKEWLSKRIYWMDTEINRL
jgi:hypothetical protein